MAYPERTLNLLRVRCLHAIAEADRIGLVELRNFRVVEQEILCALLAGVSLELAVDDVGGIKSQDQVVVQGVVERKVQILTRPGILPLRLYAGRKGRVEEGRASPGVGKA